VELRGQGAFVAGGEIGINVFAFAHAGDDGAHAGIVEDEAQSHFGHRHAVAQQRLEGVGAGDAGLEIFGNEISAAPIVFGPLAVESERAGERTFIERDAGDDGNMFFAACRKKFVLGILIENVVDDLNGVNESGAHGADAVGGLPAIEAEAEGADFAGSFKFFDGAKDSFVFEPAVFPGVKLDEVERVHPNVFEALVHVLEDIVGRIGVVEGVFGASGPAAVLGRDLCGDVKFFVRPANGGVAFVGAQDFSEQLLAVAFAVGPGGVKEIAAKVHGALERIEGFGVVGTGPAAHAPHAVTNFADVPSGAAEAAIAHDVLSWS